MEEGNGNAHDEVYFIPEMLHYPRWSYRTAVGSVQNVQVKINFCIY